MENKKSPWATIWTSPRVTIREIVQENPNRSLWVLSAVYGFSSLLNIFQSMLLGESLSVLAIFILAVILSPIYGYISFSVWSWIVHLVGKLFKGQAGFKAVRASYAWSCVPFIINIPLWLLMAAFFGHQLFLNLPDAHMFSMSKMFALFGVLIVKTVVSIWSLVIYVSALSEVQQYSILRSIFNILLSLVVIGVVFFVLWSALLYGVGSLGTLGALEYFEII